MMVLERSVYDYMSCSSNMLKAKNSIISFLESKNVSEDCIESVFEHIDEFRKLKYDMHDMSLYINLELNKLPDGSKGDCFNPCHIAAIVAGVDIHN